jgi:crossover junction endodeoxyribonuclease RusA
MIRFFCAGHPVAQGSKRHVGQGIMIETAKALKPWRQAIAFEAKMAAQGHAYEGAVEVWASFSFNRPANHYGTGRNSGRLKPSAPHYRAAAPDLDKLVRSLLDALVVSGVIRDDRYVVKLHAQKVYGTPGVSVEIRGADREKA